jgi:signal transduction histidine kinase/ABC-type molybdenum transport system ATPase subunit/photorepair protein PhrA
MESPRSSAEALLELRQVSLRKNSIDILKEVNLQVFPGEAHAIVGEHGAGKSSLCMVMSGTLRPNSGSLLVDGQPFDFLSLRKAQALGIRMVTQSNPLFENQSVVNNLFIDNRAVSRLPFISRSGMEKRAQALLGKYNFALDPHSLVRSMKLSDRVLVDILKHIDPRPRLLILDEALQKLSSINLGKIIDTLKGLKKQGTAILFVTHRVDDIYHFADRVSIIKNGEILITDSVQRIDKINLIRLAYTQINNNEGFQNLNQEFYQLLKYNEVMLQKLPVNLIVVDSQHRLKLMSENAKAFFRRHDPPQVNVPISDLLTKENLRALELVERGLAKRNPSVFYNVPVVLNEKKIIINIKTHPIYDETFLIGYTIILEDITEQESLRAQVLTSEKLASIGLLSAGVAHEINNPLEVMCNYIELLKCKIQEPGLKRTVEKLEQEVESISQIVGNLKTFSDSRKRRIEQVDVNETIRSIIDLIHFNAKYKNIAIHFENQSDPLEIGINRIELKQVVLNMIKNSFEAMPDGGELVIESRQRGLPDAQAVELSFRDTGCGIPEGAISDIFLPFYTTKKGNEENWGLGLSVSYGIIKKYKGFITARNLAPSGCEFIITLPRS